ncbi:MAG: aminotransferase class I/II-fold pyridoxal phosphate-dependent enzyme [Gemmatimonadaceae bacterium]
MLKQLLPERQNFDGSDIIFTLNSAAQKRAATGEAVINATVGALLDDNGKLIVLNTVMELYAQLTPMEIAPYAPIAGDAAYVLALTQRHWPALQSYGVGVATPGGSGALALSIRNLLAHGDTLLTAAPFWGPYATLSVENEVRLETVPYPSINAPIDIAAWRAKFEIVLKKQGRLLFWLNDPCHNPTGRSLSANDRRAVLQLFREVSSLGAVTLLLDLAYLDYTREPNAVREALDDYAAFAREGGVLVCASLSLSKAFTIYGARAGALVFPWVNDSHLQNALNTSCRGTFSNCARAPMSVLMRMTRDTAAQQRLAAEHAHWNVVLQERAIAVDDALRAEGLAGAPWQGGFFITIECQNPYDVCERLQALGVFVVPMPEGLRVGICGLKKQDAPSFAAAVRQCI